MLEVKTPTELQKNAGHTFHNLFYDIGIQGISSEEVFEFLNYFYSPASCHISFFPSESPPEHTITISSNEIHPFPIAILSNMGFKIIFQPVVH